MQSWCDLVRLMNRTRDHDHLLKESHIRSAVVDHDQGDGNGEPTNEQERWVRIILILAVF